MRSVALVVALLAQLLGGPIGRPPAPVGDDQVTRDAGHAVPSLARNSARPSDTGCHLPPGHGQQPTPAYAVAASVRGPSSGAARESAVSTPSAATATPASATKPRV